MRILDRYKLEVSINQAIGADVEDDDMPDDPILRRIAESVKEDDTDTSWVFDVRDIWDVRIEKRKGTGITVKVLAYLESGVILDVRLDEADELLEIWRKRTYKRR